MQTTDQDQYQVRLDEADVLLFRRSTDGTMGMRVLTRQEWLKDAAYDQSGHRLADVGRRAFADKGTFACVV
jgi:hypothetical protein